MANTTGTSPHTQLMAVSLTAGFVQWKNFSTPESHQVTNRWLKRLRTLGTRKGKFCSLGFQYHCTVHWTMVRRNETLILTCLHLTAQEHCTHHVWWNGGYQNKDQQWPHQSVHTQYWTLGWDPRTKLRSVLTFVTAHTFCASTDTLVSCGWYLLIQGYFCVV